MDPSAQVCSNGLSFNKDFSKFEFNDYSFTNNKLMNLTFKLQTTSLSNPPGITYVNSKNYEDLQTIKDRFDDPKFRTARDNTNPFEKIGRSIFMSRAAIKLANSDAIHKLTNDVFTFDQQQSDVAFTFCDIAAGPGGFTQYIQYRFPFSKGYGITLNHPSLNWNFKLLDMNRFTAYYGNDNTGDLYVHSEDFIDYVIDKENYGVDLVTGDGGFDLEENSDKSILKIQEFLSSRLFLVQALVGIFVLKLGGTLMIKVFDTVTRFSAELLYVLSCCFESIILFKPVSSRPANGERYLICKGRRENISDYKLILLDAARNYGENEYLTKLFEEELPDDFIEWITMNNNMNTERQLNSGIDILNYINDTYIGSETYNLDKFLTIWNLPDNVTKKFEKRYQRRSKNRKF